MEPHLVSVQGSSQELKEDEFRFIIFTLHDGEDEV